MQIAARQSESGQSPTKFDRTHEVILKAAARLFCEKGYAASTLRDIAASAGMKAGSLYYHFNSKEEMLDAILDQGVREIDVTHGGSDDHKPRREGDQPYDLFEAGREC